MTSGHEGQPGEEHMVVRSTEQQISAFAFMLWCGGLMAMHLPQESVSPGTSHHFNTSTGVDFQDRLRSTQPLLAYVMV